MNKHTFETEAQVATPSLSAHVLLLRDGRVLLARRRPDAPFAPGLWHAGAAGKANPGEDVVRSAVRECREELGITLSTTDLEFAHVVHSHEGGADWVHFFFACRNWEGTPANLEPRKHAELKWFPAHRLPEDSVDYCAQAVAHFLLGEPFSQHRTTTRFPAAPRSTAPADGAGDAGVAGPLHRTLGHVAEERRRQQSLYGVQNLPPGTGPEHRAEAVGAQARVDSAGREPTWWDLAYEELCEARAARTDEELYGELVQTCAVLVQWAQSLSLTPDGAGR
ncbi:NUDIX domain-containing protein [Nocardiopsis sp. CT-R113]|uniref:NUDIX domain-containing protein n=1 Tax=Nocardiopsis codii TaxID=3065942 RepID=A0ABU7KCH4_9ACTN|nr:NUDIX domain-containing protein [Nocardiopsis sp. CT-R113]MEE2039936.1 NUDIX domain-containing protein [Nocardiopsis sp. CT-R113]